MEGWSDLKRLKLDSLLYKANLGTPSIKTDDLFQDVNSSKDGLNTALYDTTLSVISDKPHEEELADDSQIFKSLIQSYQSCLGTKKNSA